VLGAARRADRVRYVPAVTTSRVIAVGLLGAVGLVGAPTPAAAEPRPIEKTVRIGFANFDAPADCSYCAALYAPGVEAAVSSRQPSGVELRAQAWWYQSAYDGRALAVTLGLGVRRERWSARANVGGQWISFHEGDGGSGISTGLVAAAEVAAETGRVGRVATELQVRYAYTFDDGGSGVIALGYGVVW
jgi:hypothetical protein